MERAGSAKDVLGEAKTKLDPRDPGGLLSGQASVTPDIERMRAFAFTLEPGDVVFACSDGIVDNFDPSNLHEPTDTSESNRQYTPAALGGEGDKWEHDKANPDHVALAQQKTAEDMANVVKGARNGQELSDKLYEAAVARTDKEKLLQFATGESYQKHESGGGKNDDAASAFFEYKP